MSIIREVYFLRTPNFVMISWTEKLREEISENKTMLIEVFYLLNVELKIPVDQIVIR